MTPRGSKPKIESAVKVFPDPLSPTTPTASPGKTSKEMLLTKVLESSAVSIRRFLTSIRGLLMTAA